MHFEYLVEHSFLIFMKLTNQFSIAKRSFNYHKNIVLHNKPFLLDHAIFIFDRLSTQANFEMNSVL